MLVEVYEWFRRGMQSPGVVALPSKFVVYPSEALYMTGGKTRYRCAGEDGATSKESFVIRESKNRHKPCRQGGVQWFLCSNTAPCYQIPRELPQSR